MVSATQQIHFSLMEFLTEKRGRAPAVIYLSTPLLKRLIRESIFATYPVTVCDERGNTLFGVPVKEFSSSKEEFSFAEEVNEIVYM